MTYRIRNWEKWQSYRGDRGQPPWIKVHRCLMRNDGWVQLTDAQRGHLVSIWLLAADRDGQIPASPQLIQKLCYLDQPPDLQLLMDLGFIEEDNEATPPRRQCDAKTTPRRRQHDAPEAEADKNPPYPPNGGTSVCEPDPTEVVQSACQRHLNQTPAIPKADQWAQSILQAITTTDDFADVTDRFFAAVARAAPSKPWAWINRTIADPIAYIRESGNGMPAAAAPDPEYQRLLAQRKAAS